MCVIKYLVTFAFKEKTLSLWKVIANFVYELSHNSLYINELTSFYARPAQLRKLKESNDQHKVAAGCESLFH